MLTIIGLTLIIGWLFGSRTVSGIFIFLALFFLFNIPYYWFTSGFDFGVMCWQIIAMSVSFFIGCEIAGL